MILMKGGIIMEIKRKHFGIVDLETTIDELRNNSEELTVDQVIELRKLELLENIENLLGTIVNERLF